MLVHVCALGIFSLIVLLAITLRKVDVEVVEVLKWAILTRC